jgi:hypothetical protein
MAFPFSNHSYVLRLRVSFSCGQIGAVILHFVFQSIPHLSGGPSAAKIFLPEFVLGFSCRTSSLHSQATVFFQHACTLAGSCLQTFRAVNSLYRIQLSLIFLLPIREGPDSKIECCLYRIAFVMTLISPGK